MSNEIYHRWASETVRIRQNIIKMITAAESGHPGGSLSMVELIYALFARDGVMKHNPKKYSKDQDHLVLSKGHGVPALYSIMSATGYDISEDELMTLRRLGSRLQGHPDRVRMPFIEASTGSLGQGASIALGMAMAHKMDKTPYHIYSILGDGEMQEGQIWEVALSAPHHKIKNLTLILDYNKAQIDGKVSDVLSLEPLKPKWEAMGWKVIEIDGHKYSEIVPALKTRDEKPIMIIAHTIKGKGVSFMEGMVDWHGKAPSKAECEKAIGELTTKTSIGL